MVAEREEGGPFKDLFDFADRVDAPGLNKRQLENLVARRRLRCAQPQPRARASPPPSWSCATPGAPPSDRASQQVSLFGDLDAAAPRFSLPLVDDWPMIDRLQHEFEAIGFYLSAHPLDAYGTGLRRLEVVRYGELRKWLVGRSSNRAKLAGIVLGRQERDLGQGQPLRLRPAVRRQRHV